jgi:hypothetical protein
LAESARVRNSAAPGGPLLILGERALPWSFAGYGPPCRRPSLGRVITLTPPGTLRVLAAGCRPLLHPTAG